MITVWFFLLIVGPWQNARTELVGPFTTKESCESIRSQTINSNEWKPRTTSCWPGPLK